MYLISKKYTSKGQDRFGSAIFINDIEENIVDSLKASKRDQSVLVILVLLIITKISSANFLGIIITLPLYYLMYFLSEKKVILTYTDHRILVEREYKNPRSVIGLSNTLIIVSLVIIIRLLFPQIVEPNVFRLDGMYWLFQVFGISNILFFQFKTFFVTNRAVLLPFDSVITLLANVWFISQYRLISYNFEELNYSQISEQLVRAKKRVSLSDVTILIFFYLLFEILFFTRFSFILLTVFYFAYKIAPRPIIAEYSLFGTRGRTLIKDYHMEETEFLKLHRTTGSIFNWDLESLSDREFPANLISPEVASYYSTGRQATSETAFKQANVLGGLISMVINIVVIISLYNYAVKFLPSAIDTVFLLGLGIIAFTIILFIIIQIFITVGLNFQSNEQLMIGRGFVGRYIAPSLWILRGNKLEGTTVQRGGSQPWIRYDKVNGLIFQWRKIAVLGFFLLIIGAVIVWNALGGVNLSLLPYIFPSLIDFSLQFLEEKANAELSFFIIAGFVFWGLTLFVYPQYYARTRPSLYLDMEYASISPVILKDFDEYQEASVQFTKSLLHDSKSNKRNKVGRPGTYLLNLTINDVLIGGGTHLKIIAGENKISNVIEFPIELPYGVFSRLITTGIRGYAKIDLTLELFEDQNIIWENSYEINILYTKNKLVNVDIGSYGYIQLELSIIDQRS